MSRDDKNIAKYNNKDVIITEEEHFGLNVKTSKYAYERSKYEGFDKTINGFKLIDEDYESLETLIDDQIFRLLTILSPLHPKHIDKIAKSVRDTVRYIK
jgi:hypothetical protein